jgi:hypothetical protein
VSGPPDVGCHGHGSDLLKNVPSVPIVVQFGGKEVQIEMDSSIWREDNLSIWRENEDIGNRNRRMYVTTYRTYPKHPSNIEPSTPNQSNCC